MKTVLDTLLAWLMRPRVRVVRRWAFLVTVPAALLVAHLYGAQQGAVVIAIRLGLWTAVALVAWRLKGERGDALRDLLMHPRGRALARAEFDVVTAIPRALVRRVAGHRRSAGTAYHRGTSGLALALAFTPVIISETVVFHLLLGDGLIAWISTGLHAYSLLWLWVFCLGARLYPHRVGERTVVLRNGPMYRVAVPVSAIADARVRTERVTGPSRPTERSGAVLLPVRGRVDLWLEFDEPVRVQRPLHEPLTTRRLGVASDDPESLVALLLAPAAQREARTTGHFGLVGALDVSGLARDAVQPG